MLSNTVAMLLISALIVWSVAANEASISKRLVSNNQQQCLSRLVRQLTNNDLSCVSTATAITSLLGQDNTEDFLALEDSLLEFCRPSCGRRIIAAWDACDITSNNRNEIDLFVSVCSSNRESLCFPDFDEIFGVIEDILECGLQGSGSPECPGLLDEAEDDYDCCISVAADFLAVINGNPDIRDRIEDTYMQFSLNSPDEDCGDILINETSPSVGITDSDATLSPNQIVSIIDNLSDNEDLDSECTIAVSYLLTVINSDDIILSLARDPAALAAFCSPTCGPAVIQSLRSFSAIQSKLDFLVGLCSIEEGTACHLKYNDIRNYLDDIVYCIDFDIDTALCPAGCLTSYRNGADELGCCTEVLIEYADAVVDEVQVDDIINLVYGACGLERPSECSSTALEQQDECSGAKASSIGFPAITSLVSAIICLVTVAINS